MMFGEDFDLGSTQSSMWSFVKTVGCLEGAAFGKNMPCFCCMVHVLLKRTEALL